VRKLRPREVEWIASSQGFNTPCFLCKLYSYVEVTSALYLLFNKKTKVISEKEKKKNQ
jgi:hypothetical protein